MWSPYTDAGIIHENAQPARTRAIALQISKLAEISSDLLVSFYQPGIVDKPQTKQAELKKLTDIHTRLEAWKNDLPSELEPKEGQLPPVLVMHMFFQLLYIHLYRPFLRFTKSTSPLPSHVSPRKFCTQAASAISKLLRLYKRTHGLRQVINKVVYIAHSACTIHLLNLPDKNAKRDIIHGIKQLEEMGDCWTAARRTLRILCLCAERWKIELPDEAQATITRTRVRWGSTDPSPGPVSPNTLASLTQQITSRAVPDLMAQNIQRQQQQQQAQSQNMPNEMIRAFHHEQLGLLGNLAPSPSESAETRRSSGNFSLPPRSAADLTRGAGRIRPSTQLSKEQQDAWNALQARMASRTSQPASRQPNTSTASAQNLFGGIESLIGESQDWWYDDQNQLALGFDNWNAPTPEWSGMNNGGAVSINEMSGLAGAGSNGLFAPHSNFDNYPPFSNQTQMNGIQKHLREDGSSFKDGQYQYQQQQQRQQAYNPAQTKRHLSWEDDDYYY